MISNKWSTADLAGVGGEAIKLFCLIPSRWTQDIMHLAKPTEPHPTESEL